MLKPADPVPAAPDTLSDLVGRAKDQARDWAMAEVALYKTIGTEKATALKVPIALFGAALFLGHAALLALVATLFVGLAQVMNPALAGLLTVVILGAGAAIAAKVGLAKLKAPK